MIRFSEALFPRYGSFTDFFNKNLCPLRSPKNWIWNFGLKLCTHVRIVYGERFNAFGCSFLEIWILKYWPFYTNDASYFKKATTKSVETFTINYSHFNLYIRKVSSQNSKFNFFVTWGGPQVSVKKFSKSSNRASGNRTILDFESLTTPDRTNIVTIKKRFYTWRGSLVRQTEITLGKSEEDPWEQSVPKS